jgi:hypothetical protein
MAVVSLLIGMLGVLVAFGSVLFMLAGMLSFVVNLMRARARTEPDGPTQLPWDDDSGLALSA